MTQIIKLLKRRWLTTAIIIILILGVLYGTGTFQDKTPDWITDTVSRGEVANLISVSGVIKAEDTAELRFPQNGIVSSILVTEGDIVETGQILATLEQSELQADRQSAYGDLLIARANRDELIAGPRSEARDVTEIAVAIARENLEREKKESEDTVENTYRALLSTGLEALPVDKDNTDAPPTISGTYTCGTEGSYTISIFRSNSPSGYSFRLSGLESGTYTAYTESPAPFGSCGLFIQFDEDEIYASKDWVVTIPNARSASYVTNLNAYTLAKQQAANAIESAEQALEKALREQNLENATPRDEALARANAAVIQAEARLRAVEARIEERTLRAPFTGTISNIALVVGETTNSDTAMTLVAEDRFELTVRVPEIDITRIAKDQPARVVFDARPDQSLLAHVAFISPLATEIDGVAYFETKIILDEQPAWLRGGLNADVDIIVDQRDNVLRVPKRFVIDEEGSKSVLIPQGDTATKTPVETGFVGNNGYIEITGLNEGATVIAP